MLASTEACDHFSCHSSQLLSDPYFPRAKRLALGQPEMASNPATNRALTIGKTAEAPVARSMPKISLTKKRPPRSLEASNSGRKMARSGRRSEITGTRLRINCERSFSSWESNLMTLPNSSRVSRGDRPAEAPTTGTPLPSASRASLQITSIHRSTAASP